MCWGKMICIFAIIGGPSHGVTFGTLPSASLLMATSLVEEVLGSRLGHANPITAVRCLGLRLEEGTLVQSELLQSDTTCQNTGDLSLSPSMTSIPHRVVTKARSWQFVDMKDFLFGNVALMQQLETFGIQTAAPAFSGRVRPQLREISTLPFWLYSFLAYMAVRTGDIETRSLLAYTLLIIREAQRHGG